jgi:hypothetical protein
MPPWAKVLADWPLGRQEALGMAGGLETSHGAFPLPRGLMRVFRTVVEAFVLPMFDAWYDVLVRCLIAAELVRDEHTRHVLAAFEQLAKELLGGSFVAAALHQDVQHIPVLVDRAPEVLRRAVDLQENLIEVPFVARLGPAAAQLVRVLLPKLQAPLTHRFVGHHDAAFR